VIVTENELDQWVRGNSREAQGLIVELVWRLAAASCPRPKDRRFPLGDSIGQHGADGFLDVALGSDPFVPEGRSYWEIGTGLNAGDKATSDYRELTNAVPETIRQETAFVFVTPLSGRREFEFTWKEGAQGRWLEDRRARKQWREVRVIDGTKIVDWLQQFPSVEVWLGHRIGLNPPIGIESLEQHWNLIRTIGEPPPLIASVFVKGRDDASGKLKEVFGDTAVQLKFETRFPTDVPDFVAAVISGLDDESRADTFGRCVLVSSAEAWEAIVRQKEKLILVANSSLDLSGEIGTKLIQKARRGGHAVVFGGLSGGIPDPSSIQLRSPRANDIKNSLEQAGYKEERARILSQKSAGNLGSRLRCLQNVSLLPTWAESSDAADLAIAVVLGSWSDGSQADRAVAEGTSGKTYGEWIERMRKLALQAGTPLTQNEGTWKFTARFEGWFALGPRLFDEHLDRVLTHVLRVFREHDPQFDLPTGERYAASLYGKVLTHSRSLRVGLAETLALLGSQPKALTSCSYSKPSMTAVLAVRGILSKANWRQWAALNDVTPLLAEAAPAAFLDGVEAGLLAEPCPFIELYAQEDGGITGRTYMAGILWALETLAWDPDFFSRALSSLGRLATIDPGGRYSNRPAESLTTILLPWMPQTIASVDKRANAVASLLLDSPEIAWQLLLSLLPKSHSSSSGSRKPIWRDTIPADWTSGVTHKEYFEQVTRYAQLALTVAKNDRRKLSTMIGNFESLPPQSQIEMLQYLASDDVRKLVDSERMPLWTELTDLIVKHTKFADADWALGADRIQKLQAVADGLAPLSPTVRYQRLFGERDFDLYEENGDFREQEAELLERRKRAVAEIAEAEGPQGVLQFALSAQSPWRVGVACGAVSNREVQAAVLPSWLASDDKRKSQFADGFVRARFNDEKWTWADSVVNPSWNSVQIAELLSCLPFGSETWARAKRQLGADEREYWIRTTANPYEASGDLDHGIDQLLLFARPHAALRCLYRRLYDSKTIDIPRAVQALLLALNSGEGLQAMDSYQITEIIKALQASSVAQIEDLMKIEWGYLQLLEHGEGVSPLVTNRVLASNPHFFCEVVRMVFRPKGESIEQSSNATNDSQRSRTVATNAYRLLRTWNIPPGLAEDGFIDGTRLVQWLEAVSTEARSTGHLEVALTIVGQVLTHSPVDRDGLWISRDVANALDDIDAGDMRDGFRTELFNSRGAHWVDPSGKPELDLAKKYAQQADAIEDAGFSRLGAVLRELASSYVHDAARIRVASQADH
jgi:hypothetical protein